MAKKRFSPKQVVAKLRQIEVLLGGGKSLALACKEAGITEVTLRDELLDGEIFYSLKEARIVIERWRREYNEVRPHSSLGYRPPAPAARSPKPITLEAPPMMQ